MTLQHRNHYVACLYLKRFACSPRSILVYRVLVAHSRVPLWQPKSISGVGYHSHLYTRIASGVQSDEVEKWLNTDFEAPAEGALRKATEGMRLAPTDWHNLIRFVAAQDVRTPARMTEILEHSEETVPEILTNVVHESVRRLEEAKKSGQPITPAEASPYSDYIPVRVTTEIKPGQQFGTLKAETVVGRAYWLFSMRHLLTSTIDVLLQHRWSILRPAQGLTWFTSDNPVVRLNYYGNGNYDFRGGWGRPGTEIFIPLDPHHLMYTKIGERPRARGSVMSRYETEMIRRFIAEHAHRFIFGAAEDAEVPRLRPRHVNPDSVRNEQEQWRRWHEQQTTAEQELMEAKRGTV